MRINLPMLTDGEPTSPFTIYTNGMDQHAAFNFANGIIACVLDNPRAVHGVRMGKSGLLEHASLANQIQGFMFVNR